MMKTGRKRLIAPQIPASMLHPKRFSGAKDLRLFGWTHGAERDPSSARHGLCLKKPGICRALPQQALPILPDGHGEQHLRTLCSAFSQLDAPGRPRYRAPHELN